MPNTPLSTNLDLLGRVENGASLTTAQGDTNLTDVEEAVNGIKAALVVSLNNDGTFKDNTIQPGAVAAAANAKTYAVDVGVANAYYVQFTTPYTSLASLVGVPLYIKATNANTTASTLKVDGLAITAMKYKTGVEVPSGTIQADQIFVAIYDGTIFQFHGVVAPITTSAAAAVAGFRNLKIINNSGAPASQLDITIDEACLRSAAGRYISVTGVSKTLNMATAAAVQGRETGLAESASTWYYVWLAVTADGATVGTFFAASASALDISAILGWSGDIYKVLIGQAFNDGSSNLISIFAVDRTIFILEQAVMDDKSVAVNDTYEAIAGTELTAFRAAVPPNAKTFGGTFGSSSSAQNAKVAIAATAPTATTGIGAVSIAGTAQNNPVNGFTSSAPFQLPMLTYLFYFKATLTSAKSRVVITNWTW